MASTSFWMTISVFLFVVGLITGMYLGTYVLIHNVAEGLSGSTFIVNFNETKFIEEFNKTIVPEIIKDVPNG